jgi:YgiT-type zinc finger domain-containing protein
MTCDICGEKDVRVRRVARTYGRGDDLIVIQDVPIVSCPHCGESYLEADTLHELDRIKRHRGEAARRAVAVANFG